MRIIGGKFKGKKLIEPKDKETRPLKDLTKESIFNIINHSNKFSIDLKKAQVLDLFSGVGSFGIECLSQGASHVTFIEKYEAVLPILKKYGADILRIWVASSNYAEDLRIDHSILDQHADSYRKIRYN